MAVAVFAFMSDSVMFAPALIPNWSGLLISEIIDGSGALGENADIASKAR